MTLIYSHYEAFLVSRRRLSHHLEPEFLYFSFFLQWFSAISKDLSQDACWKWENNYLKVTKKLFSVKLNTKSSSAIKRKGFPYLKLLCTLFCCSYTAHKANQNITSDRVSPQHLQERGNCLHRHMVACWGCGSRGKHCSAWWFLLLCLEMVSGQHSLMQRCFGLFSCWCKVRQCITLTIKRK